MDLVKKEQRIVDELPIKTSSTRKKTIDPDRDDCRWTGRRKLRDEKVSEVLLHSLSILTRDSCTTPFFYRS